MFFAEVIASASGKKMFGEQKKDSSYVCKSEENLQMSSGVTAKFSNVVLKPFSSEKPDSHGIFSLHLYLH